MFLLSFVEILDLNDKSSNKWEVRFEKNNNLALTIRFKNHQKMSLIKSLVLLDACGP